MRPSKKQEIIETASKLFCKYGYQSTGIDKVIAEAGIAKMTLYSNFKSKDELILACIKKLDEDGYAWFVEHVNASAKDARGKLNKIFDVWHEFVTSDQFYGCPFIRASSEFSDLNHQVHVQALAHKTKLNSFLQNLCKEAEIKNPKLFASKIQILLEGTTAMVQLTGDASLTKQASESLRSLLQLEKH